MQKVSLYYVLLVVFAIPIFMVLSIGATLASVMLAVVGMMIALFGAPILSACGLFRCKGHGILTTLGFLALLALVMAVVIMFIVVLLLIRKRAVSNTELLEYIDWHCSIGPRTESQRTKT